MVQIQKGIMKLMKSREFILTDQGFAKCEEYLGVNDLYDPQDPWAHYY